MIKGVQTTFGGIRQDINKSSFPNEFYFDAEHIRITSTDSQTTGKVVNEKGNLLKITIPSPVIDTVNTKITYGTSELAYTSLDGASELDLLPNKISGTQVVLSHVETRDGILLFTTDNNGFDCIWELKNLLLNQYDLVLLYTRDLGFSTDYPIQAIFNYENKKIQKVYWVDGNNQLRFLNKEASILNGDIQNLIDINSNVLDIVSNFKLSQVQIVGSTSGGTHTSGMIQYAYTLYRLNGAQTRISPLSELVPLDKGAILGGGNVNEIVGKIPLLEINNIDKDYTHIKVYAIKYTSLNVIPEVSIIIDKEIDNYTSLKYEDDGNKISVIDLVTFRFLGSNPIIPKHIEAKDNILFAANIKELQFDIDFDARAYSFNAIGDAQIIINKGLTASNLPGNYLDVAQPLFSTNTDMINPDFDTFKFQENGNILGGTGKFLSYNIDPVPTAPEQSKRYFKSNEIYRLGIEFYNKLGQKSLPKWIADFKAPVCNLNNTSSALTIDINADGIAYLKGLGVVGYRVLRVQRNEADKSRVCQGFLNGMMVFDTDDASNSQRFNSYTTRKLSAENNLKLPNHLIRPFNNLLMPLLGYSHLKHMKNGSSGYWGTEMASDVNGERSSSFQFNRMFQLYSPDILFGAPTFSAGMKFSILGMKVESATEFWGQERNINTHKKVVEGKTSGKLSVHAPGVGNKSIIDNITYLQDHGLIGTSGGGNTGMDFYQYYREYKGLFTPSSTDTLYNIYGTPEVAEKGAGRKLYNNDGKFAYTNSMESIITDFVPGAPSNSTAVTSTNSYGNKCLTIVQGDNNPNLDTDARKSMEELRTAAGISTTSGVLVCDIIRTLSNQYGGNTYEDKTRSMYIPIGAYVDLTSITVNSSNSITNHGDIFVNDFKFLRVGKTDVERYSTETFQWTELVTIPLETSIDLANRNDTSFGTWDNRFQPKNTEYENYNRVYSQEDTTVISQDTSFKFKKIKEKDTSIVAAKIKVPGEFIDSWTDLLDNEELTLDGKYGPVNSIVNFRDELYTLQDEAIAKIIINPRVQVQSSNSLSIELGRGTVLYDYKYLTTSSGTVNKWSVIKTPTGFYYYDTLNNFIGKMPDNMHVGLTNSKYLHSKFINNVDYTKIVADNPLIGNGVSAGYDLLNKDMYMTFLQGGTSFTACFNELKNEFVDFKKYYPGMYMNKGFKFLALSPDNNKLYLHGGGEYNKFFETYVPSTITILVNSAEHRDAVFNNILFRSELYDGNVDVPNQTISSIRVYNEYQDTGEVQLVPGMHGNIRRKFRDWKLNIPRVQGSRDRIRNQWAFIKLTFNNTSNYRLVLHNIFTFYTI